MKTELPNARKFPRFSGVTSFFRVPIQTEPQSDVDWAIYGVPYDGAVTYRPGARFGPRSIREQSAYIKPYHLVFEQHLFERYSIVDAGDSPVDPFSLEGNLKSHQAFAKTWRDQSAKTFAVGGDHSIALGNIRATAESVGDPLALIHFDSHTDTVDQLWGEKYTHASPVSRAIEEKLVDPKSSISIGIKGPVNTATELEWGRSRGLSYVTYDDWRKSGDAEIKKFAQSLGGKPCYLSFDIDCIDPVFAPGTGTPSIGGFSSSEVIELLRIFRGVQLQGADLVEVAPSLDPSYVTPLLAAHLIFEILSL